MIHLGMGSVSKWSCGNILQSGPGQSITIVVGGAAESLSAHPGTADLTLRKRYVIVPLSLLPLFFEIVHRLGFIKIAIQEGLVSFSILLSMFVLFISHSCRADLVPVFSFGENDVCFIFP